MKRTIVLFIVGFIVLSIVALFSLTGVISRYAVKTLFEPQQLTLSETTNISYDPFENALTVTDFALLHQQANTLLSMEQLLVEFDLIPLLNNHLQVNRVELTGLTTSISKDQNNPGAWRLNGWSTANLSSGNQTEEPNQQETESPKPFKISVKELRFSDIDVTTDLGEQSHSLLLNSLNLSEFELQLDERKQPQSMSFGLTADLKTANTISKESSSTSPISFEGEIELSLQPDIKFNDEAIQIKNEQAIDLNLANVNLDHASQDLTLNLNNLFVSLASLDLTVPLQDTGATKLATTLTTQLEQLLIKNHQQTVELVKLEKAKLEPATIELEKDSTRPTPKLGVKTKELRFEQLTAMKHLSDNKPTLSTLEKLVLSGLYVSESDIGIDLIQIGKSTNNLLIDEAKQLANLYLPQSVVNTSDDQSTVPPSAEPQSTEPQSTEPHSSEPKPTPQAPSENTTESPDVPEAQATKANDTNAVSFGLRINELTNVGPLSVNTVDMSVSPIYRSLIEVSHLSLQNLDSEQPEQVTAFDLDATNNKYAKIKVNSQSKPFAPEPSHDISIKLDEVDLSAISPYISGALGYHINSGQLDSNITAKVINEHIDGDAELLIRSIDLTAISDQGEESSISTGAISFNYALGMLKDSDGHVDLNVPFSGDLDNPSVGFSGFMSLIVKRATMAAAKDYLINTFVPYANVVNFALSASKHILKLRFNDLQFDAKQVELTSAQQDMVQQLSLVLEKHDSVSIKLCPISTVADLELAENEEVPTAKTINSRQVSSLLDLAQTRADNVKQALVDTAKVTSKRLLFCSPTINYGKSDTPKVTFDQLN